MKTTRRVVSVLCIVMIAIVTLALTGCGKKDGKSDKATLVGSWEYNRGSSTYAYNFKDDKTGSYSVYGTEMPFTYEDDGQKVTILYEGNTVSSTFEYKIEGNKLIIKDSFGNDVEYIKK